MVQQKQTGKKNRACGHRQRSGAVTTGKSSWFSLKTRAPRLFPRRRARTYTHRQKKASRVPLDKHDSRSLQPRPWCGCSVHAQRGIAAGLVYIVPTYTCAHEIRARGAAGRFRFHFFALGGGGFSGLLYEPSDWLRRNGNEGTLPRRRRRRGKICLEIL